ncbi:MFS transporter [Sphingomonas sp. BK235]|uniref:MFS transporter n=1 Tax=Sphingomonas sp. BK235 TaxID=2512131 RepID=UPI001049EDFE|nr:MFS transporter [Sphingomonas sp. BK235]TCP32444.1 DHA2 family multidrug resistance protein [Sphingomonas sp. BK235]
MAQAAGLLRNALRGTISARPIGAVVAVLLGAVMTSAFTRSFAVALGDLRGTFGLSVDEGAWLNTVFNAPQLLIAPAIPLAVVTFGSRRVLLISGMGFAITSALTPLAVGTPMLFLLHGLDGLLLGCFIPATLATVFANLHPRWWLIALGVYTVRLTLALHLGVPLTGFYVEGGWWPAIYWQASASAVVLVLLILFSLPERPVNVDLWRRTNKGEIALFCVGLTLIYVALDHGNRLDWLQSGTVVVPLISGIMLVVAAIAWQHVSPLPFAHPRALARRNIAIPLAIVTLYGIMSVATALLIPNFLGTMAQLKPEQTAHALWWVSAVQLLAVPLCIWLLRRTDPRVPVVLGLLAILLGCWLGSRITHVWRAEDFTPATIALGLGNGMVFLALVAMTIANAHRDEIVAMVAYIQIPRVLGPELAAAVIATLLRKREAIHSALLGGYLDAPRLAALDVSPGGIAAIVRREANVLAFADAYRFCFGIALLCLALTALLRSTPPNPVTARHAPPPSS